MNQVLNAILKGFKVSLLFPLVHLCTHLKQKTKSSLYLIQWMQAWWTPTYSLIPRKFLKLFHHERGKRFFLSQSFKTMQNLAIGKKSGSQQFLQLKDSLLPCLLQSVRSFLNPYPKRMAHEWRNAHAVNLI